jgi:hypothetical protein
MRLRSRIWAIPRRNSRRIEKPLLSASSSILTRDSSSIAVNLWPLARVSDHGLMPANISAAFNFDLTFFSFQAVIAICIRASLDKGILYADNKKMTR